MSSSERFPVIATKLEVSLEPGPRLPAGLSYRNDPKSDQTNNLAITAPKEMKTMTTTINQATINGVNVDALEQSIAAMKDDPRVAAFQFRSSSRWLGGAVIASTFAGYLQDGLYVARDTPHELGGDEPAALLGTGTQVSPTGHLLHALSHSLAVALAYHGAARRVEIESIKIDVEGKLDLQGLLGLDETVKPGFKHIHVTFRLDSPNSSAEVYDLFQYVQARSPIASTLSQAVNVQWNFEIEESNSRPESDEVRHGVNVKDLVATVGAIQENPVLARCNFYGSAEWEGGARVKSSSPGFDQAEGDQIIRHRDPAPKGYVGDEPKALLGSDAGPSSAEALLQSMANCVTVTSSYHAAARGIALDAFEVDFEGDMDLRGFVDVDDTVSPGYQNIRANVYVKAGAPRSEVEEFMKFATQHSPMCNSVSKPVQLTFSLVHNGSCVGGPGR
ncbi:MAG TPA: OsmC family protein [Bryobacteraceae bacterium]|nr:OsmC family protein [Bryobacteraceae bacterium]